MLKGTPCSRGNYAPLKTSSETRISIEVQGLGPWRGLGQRPNLTLLHRSMVRGAGSSSPRSTNPAKRVRAWFDCEHSNDPPPLRRKVVRLKTPGRSRYTARTRRRHARDPAAPPHPAGSAQSACSSAAPIPAPVCQCAGERHAVAADLAGVDERRDPIIPQDALAELHGRRADRGAAGRVSVGELGAHRLKAVAPDRCAAARIEPLVRRQRERPDARHLPHQPPQRQHAPPVAAEIEIRRARRLQDHEAAAAGAPVPRSG